jgi:hypothetical protein
MRRFFRCKTIAFVFIKLPHVSAPFGQSFFFVLPITGHEGPEGEWRYSSSHQCCKVKTDLPAYYDFNGTQAPVFS